MRTAPLGFAVFLFLACQNASSTSSSVTGSASAPSVAGSALPTVSAAQMTAASASMAPAAAASAPVPDWITAQHVLIAYKNAKGAPKNVTRTQAEAKALAEKVRDEAKAGTPFEDLVAKYSEDPGSKDRLGSVGKFTREKMAKPFSDAAFALKVDQVSGVVETPFGFHVIKRNQ